MIKIQRTGTDDADFVALVNDLDAYLRVKDGDEHAFYNQFNSLDSMKYGVVAYLDNVAVGCGAIKQFDEKRMEVKRMFVADTSRGRGIASKVLQELETWTLELGCRSTVLETGKRQEEAVGLYRKNGYALIENYGQYKGIENSLCFEKVLIH